MASLAARLTAPRLGRRVARRVRRDAPLVAVDVVLVTFAYLTLVWLRFGGGIPPRVLDRTWDFLPVVIVVQLLANAAFGVYGPLWRHAGAPEARRLMLAGCASGAALLALNPLGGLPIPRSVVLLGALLATMLSGAVRFQARLLQRQRPGTQHKGVRVVIVGAGPAGALILREIQSRPDSGLVPVVVVDDDPHKQGRQLLGLPVVGSTRELASVADDFGVDQILLAIPSADRDLVGRVANEAEAAGVPLKVLPPIREILNGRPSVSGVRDLRIEDLLGRTQAEVDVDALRGVIGGRRVLITGAGGSIGSEIARQVAALGPARLVLLDHDETHLHDTAAVLGNEAELVLADIRDRECVMAEIVDRAPDVLFHAAAHKHVPLLEAHPAEAVRTNVFGTTNVVDAAVEAGVAHLVFISTDKAARPANNLGLTKWLGEQLVVHAAPAGSYWCSVRFGNVVGSRGSVVPTFARQIAAGGPVTVTDARMTRYFMSVREAVELVLQASASADGGETFMLDMGKPVAILDLAERMVRMSGHRVGDEVAIEFVGARDGEKLAEDLLDPREQVQPTDHPSILCVRPVAIPGPVLAAGLERLADAVASGPYDRIPALLRRLANGTASAVSPSWSELGPEGTIDLTEQEPSWIRSST
jgi:FlaA1/EpsC-like NDP-sugar epimerase